MVDRAVLSAIDRSDGRRCRSRRRRENPQSHVLDVSDKLAPMQGGTQPAAPQRRQPIAGIVYGGEVSLCCPRRAFCNRKVTTAIHMPRQPIPGNGRYWPSTSVRCDAVIFLESELHRTRRGHRKNGANGHQRTSQSGPAARVNGFAAWQREHDCLAPTVVRLCPRRPTSPLTGEKSRELSA